MKKLVLISFILVALGCSKEKNGILQETIYVEYQGATMPAHLHGNRDSKTFIVLLHGGPGGSGLEYRSGSYIEPLEEQFVMVYWDQRGQGMSQGKYESSDMTVKQLSDDVNALTATLRSKFGDDISLFLLGHSWGGLLGSFHVIDGENQKQYKGWIEADGAHDLPLLNTSAIAMFKQVANEQINIGNSADKWQEILNWANGVDVNNITEEQSGEINSKGFTVEDYLIKDGVMQQGEGGGAFKSLFLSPVNPIISSISGNAANSALNSQIEASALTNALNKVTIPTLFLWGKYDFVVPPALATTGYDAIGSTDKKLVIFEKSGHSPMNNEPTKFTEAIVEFVNAHR